MDIFVQKKMVVKIFIFQNWISIINSLFFFIFFTFINNEVIAKKKINVDGKYYECKSSKNSFERTRGVRNRICIFSKTDKIEINKRKKDKKLNLKRKSIKR